MKVSIASTTERLGGCHWNIASGPCVEGEESQEIAIRIAGPVGQAMFSPESLGEDSAAFEKTIFQPDDVLEGAGCAGWASTDLNSFIALRRKSPFFPRSNYYEIERLVRALFARPSVKAAILELAAELDAKIEIDGRAAEGLLTKQLLPEDYVGKDFVR